MTTGIVWFGLERFQKPVENAALKKMLILHTRSVRVFAFRNQDFGSSNQWLQ